MDVPRSNPVGLPIVPSGFAQTPRRYPRPIRALALAVLASFSAVVGVTTAASLGAYCLTTDTNNTARLPAPIVTQGEATPG